MLFWIIYFISSCLHEVNKPEKGKNKIKVNLNLWDEELFEIYTNALTIPTRNGNSILNIAD